MAVLSTDDGRARTALAKSKVWARGRAPNQSALPLPCTRARRPRACRARLSASLLAFWQLAIGECVTAGVPACLPACSLAPAVGASSGRRHQPVEHWLRVITADNYVLDIVTMEFDIHGYKYEYNKIFMNNFFMVEYLVFIPVT